MKQNTAGFWIRLSAMVADGFLIIIVLGLITLMIYGEFLMDRFTFIELISWLYYIIVPIKWSGYTVGKRLIGIRMIRVDGSPIGLGTTVLRYFLVGLLYTASLGILAIVSALMVGIRKDNRALHDLIAGTKVIYDNQPINPKETSSY